LRVTPRSHLLPGTIRRFLERFRSSFDTIVLVMVEGAVDYSVYKTLLPLYFPRTDAERAAAIERLPADCGDEWGETLVEERKIRISVTPVVGSATSSSNGTQHNAAADATAPGSLSVFANESTMIADDELRPSALAVMTASPDA
jgi:hypothetical protein